VDLRRRRGGRAWSRGDGVGQLPAKEKLARGPGLTAMITGGSGLKATTTGGLGLMGISGLEIFFIFENCFLAG
jgi:hypothetical protein